MNVLDLLPKKKKKWRKKNTFTKNEPIYSADLNILTCFYLILP